MYKRQLNNRVTKLVPSASAEFTDREKSITSETLLKQRQEEWFRNIRKDVYLEECSYIIQDMIKTSNKGKVAKKN